MNIITVINTFLVPLIVGEMLLGVLLSVKYTQKNIYRHYFVFMLLSWAIMFAYLFFKFHQDGLLYFRYNVESTSIAVLIMGIIAFVSLVSYPLVVLSSSLLKRKMWLVVLSPMIISVAIYYGVHAIAGLDPAYQFATFGHLLSSATTLQGFMRLFLVAMFMIYIVVISVAIWKVVPLYNRYIQDNIADSDYNVDWIRTLVKYTFGVTIFYFSMLLFGSPIINLIYMIIVLLLFTYIIETALFRKTSEMVKSLDIRWTPERGWHVHEGEVVVDLEAEHIKQLSQLIDEWLEQDKPFVNTEFTANDILVKFPEFTHYDLQAVFKSRGETFQSYIRHCRISLACDIIESNISQVYAKELFSQVGFSHYSSFSRSFMATTGQAPTDYIRAVKERKRGQIPPPEGQ